MPMLESGLRELPSGWNRNLTRTLVPAVCLACCLLSANASPALGQDGQDAESGAPKFDDLMARELPLQSDVPFVAPGDIFRVLLPFPLAEEPELDEEAEQVSFSLALGTEAQVNCFAHYTGLDPAASVAAISDVSLPVGAEDSPLLARQIHDVDLFAVDHHLVAAADWLYDVEQNGEVATGMLKLRAASVGGGGLMCLQDEVGYSDTLDRIVERLVRTWTVPGESPLTPIFYEVTAMRWNGRPMVVDRLSVAVDQDGDYVIESKSADLTAVDSETLTGDDTYAIDYAYPNGNLINSIFVISESGELTHRLDLSGETETEWKVAGTFQSKPIEETFKHGVLTTELVDRWELQQFLASAKEGDHLVQEAWLADASPAAITEVTMTLKGRRDGLHLIEVSVAGLQIDMEIDDEGSMVRGQMEAAGSKLEMERLYQSGVFPRVPLDD